MNILLEYLAPVSSEKQFHLNNKEILKQASAENSVLKEQGEVCFLN